MVLLQCIYNSTQFKFISDILCMYNNHSFLTGYTRSWCNPFAVPVWRYAAQNLTKLNLVQCENTLYVYFALSFRAQLEQQLCKYFVRHGGVRQVVAARQVVKRRGGGGGQVAARMAANFFTCCAQWKNDEWVAQRRRQWWLVWSEGAKPRIPIQNVVGKYFDIPLPKGRWVSSLN